MMAVMIMLFTTELNKTIYNADDWSGHGGGGAEGQWIDCFFELFMASPAKTTILTSFGPI